MSWVQLYNSELYDFRSPSLDEVSLHTIAHSLSMQCRFNGHCKFFYSVAEHSILVYERVRYLGYGRDVRVGALMHDAAESIVGDIISPIKHLPECSEIRRQIEIVEDLVTKRWPGNYTHRVIKQADLELLATEKEQVMHTPPMDWGWLPKSLPIKIDGLEPAVARDRFLELCSLLNVDS